MFDLEKEIIQIDQPPESRTVPIRNETAPEQPAKASVNDQMKYPHYRSNWLEKTRGNLMIVATVIASMAFQAAINPPALLWKNDSQVKGCSARIMWDDLTNKRIIDARNSALNCIHEYSSQVFVICNTASFSASLSIIFLLTVLPLRHKISLWTLLVAMSITLIFMAATYIMSISLADGSKPDRFEIHIFLYYVMFWTVMIVLLIIILVLKVIFWLLKSLVKSCKIHKR